LRQLVALNLWPQLKSFTKALMAFSLTLGLSSDHPIVFRLLGPVRR